MRHGNVDEYYLDLTHFCLFIRLKQCYRQKKNQCTSFYFLLQQKCFCHIILHHWFEGMFSTKTSRLFLVPFTWEFPISHSWHHIHPPSPIPFLSFNSCPKWLLSRILWAAQGWEQGRQPSHCFQECREEGIQTHKLMQECKLWLVPSAQTSVHLVRWEVFHGIF